jgi:Flp pilus assembly protein, protease CpaA
MSLPHILIFAPALVWLAALCRSDIRHRRLPNALTLGGAAAALALRAVSGWAPLQDGLAGGLLCAAFLLVPFFLNAAGGGDVKMLFACGCISGLRLAPLLIAFTAFAGFLLAFAMIIAKRANPARLKHAARCAFDISYDRAAGRAALPPRDSEKCRVPFALAIAAGMLCLWGAAVWQEIASAIGKGGSAL